MNIQKYRRTFTKKLSNLLKTTQQKSYQNVNRDNIKNILVIRPNHRLGNQVLLTALFCELENHFPKAKITYLGKGKLSIKLFKNFKNINDFLLLPKKHFRKLPQYIFVWISLFFKKFDLVINANSHSSSGSLLTTISNAKYKILNNEEANKVLGTKEIHLAIQPIECLRKVFGYHSSELYPSLDLKYHSVPKIDMKWYQTSEIRKQKPIVFLFTNATGDKDFDGVFWSEIYSQLKIKLPNHHIVEMLPIENISKFNFEIDYFYSKNLEEMCLVLNQGSLCITADCGIMHLAVASRIPTIGLFKFDNIEKYKPYGNKSKAINTRLKTSQEITQEISNYL